MKISHKHLTVPLLTLVCLFAGCSRQTQEAQGPRPTGFPVRVGIQDNQPLPVKLDSSADNSIFVEFKPSDVTLPVKLQPGPDDMLPVTLVLEDEQLLPIKINSDANAPLPVILQVRSDKPLPVVLNISKPLPVELNIPDKIFIYAGVAIGAILLVWIVLSFSLRQKQR